MKILLGEVILDTLDKIVGWKKSCFQENLKVLYIVRYSSIIYFFSLVKFENSPWRSNPRYFE